MEENPNNLSSLSYWILEFILRQPIPNYLLHSIFLTLNFPPNLTPQIPNSLIKSILLRRIASNPISIHSLSSLELLHQLNLHDPDGHLIQLSYCHVAVGSTLRFLAQGDVPEFSDAVERIWVRRIGDLEASEGNGLVSEGLMGWKGRMEMAAGSERAREEVVKEWRAEEGLAVVREFLAKELEVMGPTRLESEAREMVERWKDGNLIEGGEQNGGGQVRVSLRGNSTGDCIVNEEEDISNGMCVDKESSDAQVVEQAEVDTSLKKIDNGGCSANEATETLDDLGRGMERTCCGQVEQRQVDISSMGVVSINCLVVEYRESSDGLHSGEERTAEQVEQWEVRKHSNGVDNGGCIANDEEEILDGLGKDEERNVGQVEQGGLHINSRGIDSANISVPTREVKKVKENLKRSLKDLKNVVVDPLPSAKMAATSVTESKSMEVLHREKQGAEDVSAPFHSADKGSDSVNIEQNNNLKVSGHSLFDRNPTARTYEWEDESIESPSDNASSPSKKLRLPTPRAAKVSPLKLLAVRKVARKRKRWSVEEEDALREAVNKHGRGNWKIMLNNHRDVFQDRTEIDLKDKWRNMTKP